jgi:hypothetical protein
MKAKLFYIISFLAVIILSAMCSSCESQSGHRAAQPPIPMEKVVIINADEYDMQSKLFLYKVNRSTKGVVAFIYDANKYAKGDTIFHRFYP